MTDDFSKLRACGKKPASAASELGLMELAKRLEAEAKSLTAISKPFQKPLEARLLEKAAAALRSAESRVGEARHVWDELSVLVGCTSPDGSAELDQVRLLQERTCGADKAAEAMLSEARRYWTLYFDECIEADVARKKVERRSSELTRGLREALNKWEQLGKDLAMEHDKLWVPEINGKRIAELRKLACGASPGATGSAAGDER